MRIWLPLLMAGAACAHAEDTRSAFLRLLDRPRVPLAAETSPQPSSDGLVQLRFTYATEAGQRVPGLLLKQAGEQRRPVVIVLHGTGGNKEGQLPVLRQLAARGFVAVAIDGRYHGERSRTGKGSGDYNAAILRAWQTGREHPFLYDTVWDALRLIDYLETRSDVDAARIGMIGFSKGGMETYLAAAVDERIRVAVPCIGAQSFRWALDHESWQSRVGTIQFAMDGAARELGAKVDAKLVERVYDTVVPGIAGQFDGPAMLPLIAPRPLLTINGETDARTPMPGLMECLNAAKRAYGAAGATERFDAIIEKDTGHKVTPEALESAVKWFERWLAPQSPRRDS